MNQQQPPPVTWDTQRLFTPPRTWPAPSLGVTDPRAIYFEGLPFQGRPTRVFAWLGLPDKIKHESAETVSSVPGMVLIHGGLGTAYPDWVRLWAARGYAAIAFDHCGCLPNSDQPKHPFERHAHGGPAGCGEPSLGQIDWPMTDQWLYHAVADAMLAHSLLASLPGVDAGRIGATGISWGGVITCLLAGADPRLRFASPVYGCGFLAGDNAWPPFLLNDSPQAQKWLARWDPSHHLPRASMPMLWVSTTNDFAFSLGSLQRSYRLPGGPRTLSIHPGNAHGQTEGSQPEEIHAFAQSILAGGPGLTRILDQGRQGKEAWVLFDAPTPIREVKLFFTRDTGPWQPRQWTQLQAQCDHSRSRAGAAVPGDATAWFFNLTDARGLTVSSEHGERGVFV